MFEDSSSIEGPVSHREAGHILAATPNPPHVADHALLKRIGRGSYGEVWLARHTIGVFRAVKIVYRHGFPHERPFERELFGIRKFEPISRSHEGFLHILHVGMGPDCFYYIMELGDDYATGSEINPERYSPRTLSRELAT